MRTVIRETHNVSGAVVFLSCLLLLATSAHSGPEEDSVVKEGERLVHVLDCNICHTPKTFTPEGPRLDMSRLLSGHPSNDKLPEIPAASIGPAGWGGLFNNHLTAWAGPWGISFATNLTPDEETGIGLWAEDLFAGAIRNGKHMGAGRPILPPMPWEAYSRLSDEELHAVFTYLKSLPAIRNPVPDPIPPETEGE
jgi:mono/diheme cytochrome c family protein